MTVEQVDVNLVLGRKLLSVWPKAVVRECDLKKAVRRKMKGGAAQNNRRIEMLSYSSESLQALQELDKLENILVGHAINSGISFQTVMTRLKTKFNEMEKEGLPEVPNQADKKQKLDG